MIVDWILGLVGAAMVAIIAADVFQSVIVPRPSAHWRPAGIISASSWRAVRAIGDRMSDADRREDFYGTFAPALLICLLVFWVAMLVAGFGLIFFALRAQLKPSPVDVFGAIYYAGTAMLTLGFGDIVATGGLTRVLSLVAAATGLGTFAICTAYLFLLFGAFQQREAFILSVRERTGAPPSGVEFIERHLDYEMMGTIGETFREAEQWLSSMLETHLAYPVLSYFRSTHDGQSWVGTIGALLDASALIITTLDIDHIGASKMINRLGRHLVLDYANFFSLDTAPVIGIERSDFDGAYDRLMAKGVRMRDREEAWRAFAAIRMTYAGELNAMARWWRIPASQWIGDHARPSRHTAASIGGRENAGSKAM